MLNEMQAFPISLIFSVEKVQIVFIPMFAFVGFMNDFTSCVVNFILDSFDAILTTKYLKWDKHT